MENGGFSGVLCGNEFRLKEGDRTLRCPSCGGESDFLEEKVFREKMRRLLRRFLFHPRGLIFGAAGGSFVTVLPRQKDQWSLSPSPRKGHSQTP